MNTIVDSLREGVGTETVRAPALLPASTRLARARAFRQMGAHGGYHGSRRRVGESMAVHDIGSVDDDSQLTEAASHATHFERWVLAQLRRHPGGDHGLAGSNQAVMDLDTTHIDLREMDP